MAAAVADTEAFAAADAAAFAAVSSVVFTVTAILLHLQLSLAHFQE